MSWVTDVIIICSLGENYTDTELLEFHEIPPAVDLINGWLREHNHVELVNMDDVKGMEKAMQANVYGGAFNFLKKDEFVQFVKDAKWIERENVQLLMKDEEAEKFTLIELN